MPRNAVYILDFAGADNWRWRLSMRPAQVGTPDFNSVTFTEVELIDVLLSNNLTLSARFADALPIGLQEAGELSITLKLNDTDADFVDYIISPNGTAKYKTQPTNIDHEFTTSNYWELKSDFGNGGLAYSSFVVVYQGAQRLSPPPTISLGNDGTQTAEITIIDIVRLCLERVTPEMLAEVYFCENIRGKGTAVYSLGYYLNDVPSSFAVDYFTEDLTEFQPAIFGGVLKIDAVAPDTYASFGTVSDVFSALAVACEMIFAGFYSESPVVALSWETNYFNCEFYAQDGSQTWASKDLSASVPSGLNEVYLCVKVEDGVGGFFYDADGFKKFRNAWDFLKVFSEQFAGKVFIRPLAPTHFSIIFRAMETSSGAYGLTSSEIFGGACDIELGAEQFRQVTAHLSQTAGDDVSEISAARVGSVSETDFEIETYFSNAPTTDFDFGGAGWAGNDITVDWNKTVFIEERFYPNKLYIFAQPNGVSAPVPCLAFPVFKRDSTAVGAVVNPDPAFAGSPDTLFVFNVAADRVALLALCANWQNNAGLAQFANIYLTAFSNDFQFKTSAEVAQETYSVAEFGANLTYDIASEFGAAYLSGLPTTLTVNAVETDIIAGTSNLEIFGFGA